MENNILIVDGMSLLFKMYYAMQKINLTSPKSEPIAATFGFIKSLLLVIKQKQINYVAIAWEGGGKNFRHEIFTEYKANRKPAPDDIVKQIPLVQHILKEMNFCNYFKKGFEGDDIIGTLALKLKDNAKVMILSLDKDFMQLISDNISIISLKKITELQEINKEQVKDYFGVLPEQVVDVLSLMGDNVDNIPGVKGLGDKGAASLINEFGNLDYLYENLDKIKNLKRKESLINGKQNAYLSKTLVTINTNVDIDVNQEQMFFNLDNLKKNEKAINILKEYNMTSILKQLDYKEPHKNSLFEAKDDIEELKKQEWTNRNYKLVLTKEELNKIINIIKNDEISEFAFDTETTGLNIITDIPIGFSVCFNIGEAYYIPTHNSYNSNLFEQNIEFDAEYALNLLKHALENTNALVIGHNIKYDLHILHNVKIKNPKNIACTMVAAWLVNVLDQSFTLDYQTLKLLNKEKIPTSNLIGKKTGKNSMLDIELTILAEYAAEDADATLQIWQILKKQLQEINLLETFFNIEMPFLKVLLTMEKNGVYIDEKLLAELSYKLTLELKNIEEEIYRMTNCKFNIASPKQLGEILFEKIKVHELLNYKGKLTKTTLGYKTDASVLEQFVEHPLVAKILEYREHAKLLTTYIDNLPQLICKQTGRIHTAFNQIGTHTGRLSSSHPNLQNIPIKTKLGKEVRKAFTAQNKNNILIVADYSQIELRVLAHLASETTMLEAFNNNEDIHKITAAKINNITEQFVTSEQRNAAKTINFGIIYGMGPTLLASSQKISMTEAKKFIAKYFETYPQIKVFTNQIIEFAKNNLYVNTLLKRRRPMPELNTNKNLIKFAENIAVNTSIQGSAADIVKLGMINFHNSLIEYNLKSKMIIQVHDEIVVECEANEIELILKLLKNALENTLPLNVNMNVEIGIAKSWAEAKT